MQTTRIKQAALIAALVLGGYVAGVATPAAHAYTEDTTRLMNKIAGELGGINKSLQTIARKID